MGYVSAMLRIMIINFVLSGDNAVVIGMAAHRLNPKERKTAIWIGGGAAIVLRIALTAVAAMMLRIPALKLVGGLLLLWIGFSLLKQEEESPGSIKAAASMKEAIRTILIADLIMSTDNILGVAGASEGNFGLLVFGLTMSMVIVTFMGNVIASLIDRFWWLAYIGSAAIVWTGMSMIFEDPYTTSYTGGISVSMQRLISAIVTAGTLAFAHWFHRVRRTD